MRSQLVNTTFGLLITLAGCVGSTPPGQAKSASSAPVMHQDFPFAIPFEQGASKFEPGDQIVIAEVRGTSPDMKSGICLISGRYRLFSHDWATLAASVTAREAAQGIGPWNSAQTITINKGQGTFSLMLPISVDGWPHVSFYGKSSDFGGTYFGTGESVLRRWWGS
jgi:hypothetical protein